MKRFYTGNGDDGYSGLLAEGRVPKHHGLFETIGTIDEVSAVLGVARAKSKTEKIKDVVLDVQRDLYHMMAEIAATYCDPSIFRHINSERISWLEERTNEFSETVAVPSGFILPGDTESSAFFALSRTITRRAERRYAQLLHSGELKNPEILRYLNRLSSLCFVLELVEIFTAKIQKPIMANNRRS